MANKKKKKGKQRRRADAQADQEPQAAPQQGSKDTWHIIGRDALDWSFYPLPGDYPSRKEAERAARARLRYLEARQPTKTSGGQAGIQDQVWVIAPDGSSYRLTK